jgi:uncharacterized protein (DUF1800 family)
MFSADQSWDAKGHWAPYTPSDRAPWDLRRVVHLHRRAGFAATWKEIQRDLADGPAASITRLLKGETRSEGAPADFRDFADTLARLALDYRARGVPDPRHLKAWWFYRMLWGPDPLGERLTLLWHNHFATSYNKVNDAAAMHRQNEIFRKHGRGPFGKLLKAVVHDPALLIWLDAPVNRKGQPNENLGRELMELFTLGVGPYTEQDVKEAARALTGWSVEEGAFAHVPAYHDDGGKTILGKKGRWKGDDLVRILLEHPATARRLAWRIGEWLMGEKGVDAVTLDALAAGLCQHDLDIGWAVETVLRSRAFFAEANLGNRVLGPVEFLVGVPRALECFDPPPSSLVLAEWSARLGQDLFYPPNVGGWKGGRTWLSTQAIIGRANYAAALVEGQLSTRPTPFDGLALAKRHGRGRDLDAALTFYAELLTGGPPAPGWKKRLRTALGPKAALEGDTVRAAVALMVASPEVQLA